MTNIEISPTILICEYDGKEEVLKKIKALESKAMRSSQILFSLKEDLTEEDAPKLFELAKSEEDAAHDQLAKMVNALYF